MSTAKYTAGSYTTGGLTINYRRIETDLDAINVEFIPGTVRNSGKYGVVGTFSNLQNRLYGIAMSWGEQVENHGTMTADALGVEQKRGTLFHDVYGNVFTQKVRYYSEALDSMDMKWAIGGISLHLNQYMTKSNYENAIVAKEPSGGPLYHEENAYRVDADIPRERTAIVYKNGKVNLLIFTTKVTAWEARLTIWNGLGLSLSEGVLLDGGGSTAMRWKYSNGNDDFFELEPRYVRNMVTVNATTWL